MEIPLAQKRIRVLMVDDEKSFLKLATDVLLSRQCDVVSASNAEEALTALESGFFDVVVLDIQMPGVDGLALLKRLSKERPTLQVMMLSGHATLQTVVEAMKLGAFEFLEKPLNVESFFQAIRRAAEKAQLERQNIALGDELERKTSYGLIIGESGQMQEIFSFIDKAASSQLPVLITGESGTGKELVARAIHSKSNRSSYPLVVVDGSSLREELIASELFGHVKGAFTGAHAKKAGLFEVADRGSIFMDEVGELSQANQAALLRVIEYGTFRPVGAVHEVHTDVRIIAATNKNVGRAAETGEFRQDLFYRLRGMMIHLPSLSAHPSDIPLLCSYFLNGYNAKTGKSLKFSEEVLDVFKSYTWPGNVRELRYVVELSALSADDTGEIKLHHLPETIKNGKAEPTSGKKTDILAFNNLDNLTLEEFRNRYERIYVEHLLVKYKGNKSEVSRILGLSSSVFYRMLRRLGLF